MMYPSSHRFSGRLRRGLTLALLATLVTACSDEGGGQQERPPSPVTTTEVSAETAEHRVDYPGRIRGATEVAVRARVSGILEERRYDEGTAVEAGKTLFLIEPETYEDNVKAAKAELADAEAQNLRAEREWERVEGLFARNAVSERERDQARADHRAAQARLEAAESALSDAERQLRYTRVEAPVSGLTSIEAITEGNLVNVGDVLTHVIQHDPVHVYFSLPEDDATVQRIAREAQSADAEQIERSADLIFRDGSAYSQTGKVDFTDRRIDPATGSVQMRAIFPNADGLLIPGQFVRVRLTLETYEDAILIDPTAVGQGPEGPQVFTVKDGQAKAHSVKMGPVIDGKQVILEGLADGSELVINGQVAVGDGAPVKVTNGGDQEG